MIITAAELKTNLEKYLEMAMSQDIFITKNGKSIARFTSPAVNKLALLDDLVGIAPKDLYVYLLTPCERNGCPDNENTD